MQLPVLVLSSLLCLVPACGEKANAAMAEAQKAANQMVDATKNALGAQTTFADLSQVLGGITDGASADQAKAQLTKLVETWKTQVGSLGGLSQFTSKLGAGADGLLKSAMGQVDKLVGNAEIKKSIGPVLEQLKAALAGK